ncbi:acyl-[acyl-carrier-protein]--UDP-N-acetylglucosamine O-acyltransferase, partial [bacterium]|nr:acyl-[acyl-carrier-protein]--UDP-N-acetylglucosamine O-acyltransferase [bacterium]
MANSSIESQIHPTAIIHPEAQLGNRVRVGAYSVIGEGVVLGDECELQEHVSIRGNTILGKGVRVFPFAVIGSEPQHLHYKQEPTLTEIGDRTVIRESVTVHRGTTQGTGKTKIGSDSYLMAYAHVAHDCEIGSHVILCNAVQLAGHVVVED